MKMIEKAIDLLKMVHKDIRNNCSLCAIPSKNLIYSVFLNNDRGLKEEFINAFPIDKANRFYKAILIMGTAYASSGRIPNDTAISMYGGSITRNELIIIIEEIIKELSRYKESEKNDVGGVGEMKEFDLFISHANGDKESFVEELYQSMKKLDINIFYDKETLEWGDNWKDKILNGTKNAEFAIIVISENFFDREWTERELSEFLNRQNKNGQKLILPIIHNISAEELRNKYPNVADIQAIDSKKYTSDEIALMFAKQLIKRLKSN